MTSSAAQGRLASLDILRGLDLFLLLFFQPVVVAAIGASDTDGSSVLLWCLDHEVWEGFRPWDLVMPLFLFMTGAAMPFSFSGYLSGRKPRGKLYRRIARRVVVLFFFGMIVQGNLLALDPRHVYVYTNTLQAIAAGYLIASVVMLNLGLRGQIAATAGLLAAYSLPMIIHGGYEPGNSFAFMVDKAVIGRFRSDVTYTWVWSSLTFGATVMMGALAGRMMRRSANREAVPCRMACIGVTLIIAGLALSPVEPIVKRIWTSTMTLYSGGWCFLLMALFYWWVDCRGCSRGLNWLKIYGMNPITAYIIGEVIDFRSVVASVSYGLEPLLGAYYPVWLTFGNCLILFWILRMMYRRGVFLKV